MDLRAMRLTMALAPGSETQTIPKSLFSLH